MRNTILPSDRYHRSGYWICAVSIIASITSLANKKVHRACLVYSWTFFACKDIMHLCLKEIHEPGRFAYPSLSFPPNAQACWARLKVLFVLKTQMPNTPQSMKERERESTIMLVILVRSKANTYSGVRQYEMKRLVRELDKLSECSAINQLSIHTTASPKQCTNHIFK
jgi:hypothetical protein